MWTSLGADIAVAIYARCETADGYVANSTRRFCTERRYADGEDIAARGTPNDPPPVRRFGQGRVSQRDVELRQEHDRCCTSRPDGGALSPFVGRHHPGRATRSSLRARGTGVLLRCNYRIPSLQSRVLRRARERDRRGCPG